MAKFRVKTQIRQFPESSSSCNCCAIIICIVLFSSVQFYACFAFPCRVLSNVTGAIINVDEFKVHENQDGSVDKTRTDLYLHFVDRRDHSIMEVTRVLNLIDQNIERLDKLFKVCWVLCIPIHNILL